MIEREFVAQKTKEYYIKKFIEEKLANVGISDIRLKKIPLGEKIIISTSRPSLIVGSKGSNIKDLTRLLKKEFKMENPQIEINEVKNIYLDPSIVAKQIADSLEKFGSARFKGIGHKLMENIMNSGALGVELVISGKIPGARAKSWRFNSGYLKKCGDVSVWGVKKAYASALLKSGVIGIKVSIMPPDIALPDRIEILLEQDQETKKEPVKAEENKEETKSKNKSSKNKEKKAVPKKKAVVPKEKENKETAPEETKVKKNEEKEEKTPTEENTKNTD